MSISLCLIVRNEEDRLAACLQSSADLADEIIVVDTGSTDGTGELAAKLGARVFEFPWCDDFAAARNEYSILTFAVRFPEAAERRRFGQDVLDGAQVGLGLDQDGL